MRSHLFCFCSGAILLKLVRMHSMLSHVVPKHAQTLSKGTSTDNKELSGHDIRAESV